MSKKRKLYFRKIEILLLIVVLQTVKNIVEECVTPYIPETRFADKMLTMLVMIILSIVVILYAKLRKQPLSLFPISFSRWYIIATVVSALLLISTPSNYTGGYKAVFVLIYGSLITPIYEELVFRGFIWNRLDEFFKGKYSSYVISSILFGLWHIGYMIPQLLVGNLFAVGTKVAVGLFYGLVLGFVRLKTKNCYSTMLLHGVMNLFAF